jgi:sugar lactone lactonase YvrE
VDVANDGKIYFSESSTKFSPQDQPGTYEASLLDLMEHGGHGRLLVYDPQSGLVTTLLDGLNHANGVAVAHDGSFVMVAETGSYRILRIWIDGPEAGTVEPLLQELPGFPDNLTRGLDGRYWVALVAPRNSLVDWFADQPFQRKMVQRLPSFLRPAAVPYGHVIAFDRDGKILEDLQDPEGGYPMITEARETNDYLYLGSLVAPRLGRLLWGPEQR